MVAEVGFLVEGEHGHSEIEFPGVVPHAPLVGGVVGKYGGVVDCVGPGLEVGGLIEGLGEGLEPEFFGGEGCF